MTSLSLEHWSRRLLAAVLLSGQVVVLILSSKVHRRNTFEQMAVVGPDSLLVALIIAVFVGMLFTIQVAQQLIDFGGGNAVGGVLALTLARELAPVLAGVVLAA